MKKFVHDHFNRWSTVDLLKKLSPQNSNLYVAVNVLDSMRVTSYSEALSDKLEIYRGYVDGTLKYLETVRIDLIEKNIKSFLAQCCPEAGKILLHTPEISMTELIEACEKECYDTVVTAKCIFAFFYIISVMIQVHYPSFIMSFNPFRIEQLKKIDRAPVLINRAGVCVYDDDFYLYFPLDINRREEILNISLGMDDILLCVSDEHDQMQYAIVIDDEECYINDYRKQDMDLPIQNEPWLWPFYRIK